MLLKLKTQVDSQNVQNTRFSMFSKFYEFYEILRIQLKNEQIREEIRDDDYEAIPRTAFDERAVKKI